MDARVCFINNPGVPERLAPSHPVYIRDSKASTLLSSYNLVATFFRRGVLLCIRIWL